MVLCGSLSSSNLPSKVEDENEEEGFGVKKLHPPLAPTDSDSTQRAA
jgi:hypothetical protein